MKILHLCDSDYAGVAIALTEAINETTPHQARHLCKTLHPFGYPHDIWTHRPEVVEKWVRWADIVNVYDKFHMLRIGHWPDHGQPRMWKDYFGNDDLSFFYDCAPRLFWGLWL